MTKLSLKVVFNSTLSLRNKTDFQSLDTLLFSKHWCRNNSVSHLVGNKIKFCYFLCALVESNVITVINITVVCDVKWDTLKQSSHCFRQQ